MIRLTSVALIITLMLPSAICMVFPTASLSIGLLCAAAFWTMTYLVGADPPYMLHRADGYFLGLPLIVLLFLAVHATGSEQLIGGLDFGRFFVSCTIFLLLCAGAHFAARTLSQVPAISLLRASKGALICLAFLGLAAAAGVPGLGPAPHAKPIVIFAEPSHFALAALPLLLFRTAVAPKSTQLLLMGAALLVAASMQSLTMVAGVMLVASLLLRQALLLLLLIPAAGGALVLDLTYYSDRLTLTSESNNLSTLVFLQGWENAILNFNETRGFGVGFQQFGIAGSTGDIAEKISQLLSGSSLSLLDGGTTASKLTGEFGIFGIVFLLGFMVVAGRSILFLRRSQSLPPAARDTHRILFCSLTTTYTVELFIRGMGYFSPGGFLALVAVIGLARAGWRPLDVGQRVDSQVRTGANTI